MAHFRQFMVKRGEQFEGLRGSTRVKLWFEAEETTAYRDLLEAHCNSIVGVVGTLPSQDLDAKRILIIEAGVEPVGAAAAWIESVNSALANMHPEALRALSAPTEANKLITVSGSGSNGTFFSGDREV